MAYNYKKVFIEKKYHKEFSQHCKDNKTTISDFIGLLIDNEINSPSIPPKLVEKSQLAIAPEHVEKLKKYCKDNGLEMSDVVNKLIKNTLDKKLSIRKLIVESDNSQN